MNSREATASRQRLLHGAIGIGAVRLLIVLAPLILLPILLSRWGIELYGAWITANAIAGFLAALAASLLPVMVSETGLRLGADDQVGAAGTIQMFAALSIVTAFLLNGAAGLIYYLMVEYRIYALDPLTLGTIAAMLTATAIAGAANVYVSALSAIGHLGLGNLSDAARRGGELVFTAAAVLVFHAQPMTIALFMTVSATANVVWARQMFKRRSAWSQVERKGLPSLRSVSGNLSGSVLLAIAQNQILIVAPRVMIESLLGAHAVVTFSTLVSLTRGMRFMADIIVYPFQPEFSFAWGARDLVEARYLFNASSRLALWLALTVSAGLIVLGPTVISLLSSDQLQVPRALVALITAGLFIESALLPAIIWLIATGRALTYALVLLISGTLSLAAAALAPHTNLYAFAVALLLTASAVGLAGCLQAFKMLDLRAAEWLAAIVKPPFGEAQVLARKFTSWLPRR